MVRHEEKGRGVVSMKRVYFKNSMEKSNSHIFFLADEWKREYQM